MLIAYLPKEKIVVNADLYDPPPAEGNLANVSNNGNRPTPYDFRSWWRGNCQSGTT